MTREEAKAILKGFTENPLYSDIPKVCRAFDMAIKALEQQPCEDAISRKAVLDMATTIQTDDFSGNEIIEVVDIDDVKELPSVTPTRSTGRWIEKEDYNLDTYYECSECGADYCIEGDILIHKYCPNCGARMAESEE